MYITYKSSFNHYLNQGPEGSPPSTHLLNPVRFSKGEEGEAPPRPQFRWWQQFWLWSTTLLKEKLFLERFSLTHFKIIPHSWQTHVSFWFKIPCPPSTCVIRKKPVSVNSIQRRGHLPFLIESNRLPYPKIKWDHLPKKSYCACTEEDNCFSCN